MEAQSIIESIVGPAGAIVILAAFCYASWNFLTQKVWPLAVAWIQNQNSHMEALMKSHAEDREAFQEAMLSFSAGQASIDTSLTAIQTDINQVKEIVQLNIYKSQLEEVAL